MNVIIDKSTFESLRKHEVLLKGFDFKSQGVISPPHIDSQLRKELAQVYKKVSGGGISDGYDTDWICRLSLWYFEAKKVYEND